jgi:plastocyanin
MAVNATSPAGTAGARTPAAGTSCPPTWTLSTLPSGGESATFYGVTAISASDVWAVGSLYDGVQDRTLAEHWDGAAWSIVPTPNSGSGGQFLRGADGVATSDVWAVGYGSTATGQEVPLAEHWDGSAWQIEATPSPGGIASALVSVVASVADDAWAAGYWIDGTGHYQTLIEHWDGSAWTIPESPSVPGVDNLLEGVSATGPSEAWAVGFVSDKLTGNRTLIERWDGSAWTRVPSPNPSTTSNSLTSVLAVAPDDVWAAGSQYDGADNVTLVLHWDGSAWVTVASPSVPDEGNVLNALAAVSAGDLWAVGYHYPTGDIVYHTLAEHWNGVAWTIASTVNPGGLDTYNYLTGIASTLEGQAWTVGNSTAAGLAERLCATAATDAGFVPAWVTVPQGSTVAWTFPTTNTATHTVTDGSGMGLFDSGPRDPGSSFTTDLWSAGSYRTTDTETGHTGTVVVPVTASPLSGGTGTSFTITWSAAPAPAGFVFDAQIRRPGSSSFVSWKSGVTAGSAVFLPDVGTGTYVFRARLRAAADAHSGWSPTASIRVT